jgi:integrase
MAATHTTRTLQKGHNCLTRSAPSEGQNLVRRNVSALVDTLQGQAGRPSQSLTLDQAGALLQAAEKSRLHAFIVLCLLTGVRSEEARALTWDRVDLDAGTIVVWRSVRDWLVRACPRFATASDAGGRKWNASAFRA